jgi:hypothetical protein
MLAIDSSNIHGNSDLLSDIYLELLAYVLCFYSCNCEWLIFLLLTTRPTWFHSYGFCLKGFIQTAPTSLEKEAAILGPMVFEVLSKSDRNLLGTGA